MVHTTRIGRVWGTGAGTAPSVTSFASPPGELTTTQLVMQAVAATDALKHRYSSKLELLLSEME